MNIRWTMVAALWVGVANTAVSQQPKLPATVRECLHDMRATTSVAYDVGIWKDEIPADSLYPLAINQSNACIARYANVTLSGNELEAYALLHAYAARYDEAERLFAKRLAEPKLSWRDRSLVHKDALRAYAHTLDWQSKQPVQRLVLADKHLQALYALPSEADEDKIDAVAQLMDKFVLAGRDDWVIDNGFKALQVAWGLDTTHRAESDPKWHMTTIYHYTAEALATRPDAQARIAALTKLLTVPRQGKDRSWVTAEFRSEVARSDMLGKEAPPIVANHWINDSRSGMQTIAMNDGKIRLVEFTAFG